MLCALLAACLRRVSTSRQHGVDRGALYPAPRLVPVVRVPWVTVSRCRSCAHLSSCGRGVATVWGLWLPNLPLREACVGCFHVYVDRRSHGCVGVAACVPASYSTAPRCHSHSRSPCSHPLFIAVWSTCRAATCQRTSLTWSSPLASLSPSRYAQGWPAVALAVDTAQRPHDHDGCCVHQEEDRIILNELIVLKKKMGERERSTVRCSLPTAA